MKNLLAAFALLALPAAATAQLTSQGGGDLNSVRQEAGQNASDAAEQPREGERQICRRIRPSNSHQSRRVCLTAEQWRDYNR